MLLSKAGHKQQEDTNSTRLYRSLLGFWKKWEVETWQVSGSSSPKGDIQKELGKNIQLHLPGPPVPGVVNGHPESPLKS